MAGVRLAAKAKVVFFGSVDTNREAQVVTIAGSSSALPGTEVGAVKVTPFSEYPGKGRGTGGVRCQRLLKGEDGLLLGFIGSAPVRASASSGAPVELPPIDPRRDGSGVPVAQPIAACAPDLAG
jgi:DNA gyrase subunit A